MNIFDFAMQMELDGKQFYQDLIEKTNDQGLRRILGMLAEDEVKHYEIIAKMKDNVQPEMAESMVLADAKNIFNLMLDHKELISLDSPQKDLYKHAQLLEKKSQDFYQQKVAEVPDPEQQKLFQQIAAEEEKHYFLLDDIYELLLRPEIWLENAEFNHLDEY
jgi:rubrerythrin